MSSDMQRPRNDTLLQFMPEGGLHWHLHHQPQSRHTFCLLAWCQHSPNPHRHPDGDALACEAATRPDQTHQMPPGKWNLVQTTKLCMVLFCMTVIAVIAFCMTVNPFCMTVIAVVAELDLGFSSTRRVHHASACEAASMAAPTPQ